MGVLVEQDLVLLDLDIVLVGLDLMVTDLLEPLCLFPTELLCQLWWLPEQTTSLLLLPQGFDEILLQSFHSSILSIRCNVSILSIRSNVLRAINVTQWRL